MKVVVQGSEEWGNESYEELFRRILLDLGLTRMVDSIKMIIEPENSLFLISIKVRKVTCLLYTSPSPRDRTRSRMPSSA